MWFGRDEVTDPGRVFVVIAADRVFEARMAARVAAAYRAPWGAGGEKSSRGTTASCGNELSLGDAVNEIIDSVLDAADLDILEEWGDRRSDGLRLLRELMVDMLRRYRARLRRFEELWSGKEENHG